MRLVTFFLALSLRVACAYASPNDALGLLGDTALAVAAADEMAYECGATFFSDSEVQNVLRLALKYSDLQPSRTQRYHGLLYSDAMTKEYLLWPIKKGSLVTVPSKFTFTSHRIVYTRNSKEVIDVISRISTNDYTKCIRKRGLQSELSTTDGFQCGHQFFKDEVIQESLSHALKMVGGNNEYPAPYVGSLFPEDREYLLWPILSRGKLYKSGAGKFGPYFVVFSREGNFIDTIVRVYANNFLRCFRAKEPPIALESDLHRKLFVQPFRSGFQCGKTFFDDTVLKVSAELAKSIVKFTRRKRFPEKYNGHPCDPPCLLWPLMKNGNLLRKGSVGIYRLALSSDSKIMFVGISYRGQIKACDKITKKAKKNHDTSDYLCQMRHFTNQQLVDSADLGCKSMKKVNKSFPARYEGPGFEKEGPYFTFPVFPDVFFTRNPGPDRIIINLNCELVGAITSIKYTTEAGRTRRWVKCHRYEDGALPSKFFISQREAIFEHIDRY